MLVNAGQILKTTTNRVVLSGLDFRNTGLVDVREGTRQLDGQNHNFGIYRVESGATLSFTAPALANPQERRFAPSSRLEGAGKVLFASDANPPQFQTILDGDIDMTGPVSFASNIIINGRLLQTGPITFGPGDVSFNGLAAQLPVPVSVLSGGKLSFNVPTPVVLSGLDVGVSKGGGTVGGSSTITVVGPTHFLADTRSGFGANIFGTGRLVIAARWRVLAS